MSNTAVLLDTQDIVIDDMFPHPPEVIWQALTKGDLMARWLMEPAGFAPVMGQRFTFQTAPAGAWDGLIRCEVLEISPNERLVYSWTGGDEGNVGYGSRLETIVTWTLGRNETGTRLRLVHSGFVLPRNEIALKNMGEGWSKVVPKLRALVQESD